MINDIDFKYQKDYSIKMLENLNLKKEGKLPLSYRFKRRGTKLYLQVIITIENKEDSYLTNSFYGTVGLDYNDGFIELSETDRCGNLVGQKQKSKQMKGETHIRKKYNRMIHLFDYTRYKETLGNSSFRNKVNVIKVNPAYTSKIGKEKFSGRMKLNVHQAASYVIARKGLGILDKIH